MDRKNGDLYARCGVNVIKDMGRYKMWYIGSYEAGWTLSNGKLRPYYIMKYMESEDGIHWDSDPVTCMDYKCADEHGFGRPFVWKDGGIYRMMYSIRTYSRGYRIGYAESADGIHWVRKDEEAGIDVSSSGWDNQNLAYPYLYQYKEKRYLFYNGNGCGKTGVGYAQLIEK